MQLIDGDGPRILAVDIAGSKSVIEAWRRGIADAEDVLIEPSPPSPRRGCATSGEATIKGHTSWRCGP